MVQHARHIFAGSMIVLCVVVGTFAVAGFLGHTKVQAPAEISQLSKVTSQPVASQIILPGASPIPALKEKYTDDASLWRVVSKDYPLTNSHYVPAQLRFATVPSRTDKSNEERSLRTDIMPAVERLFGALSAQHFEMMIASGYRSYDLQNVYYTSYVKAYGQAQADMFSAQPGKSEHQTGLAFDISYADRTCYLDTCFGDMPAGQWLATHSYEYGFILRYPKDKTAVTKYQYEPWHFRYVGTDLAKALHESGLTLDEALPYLQQIPE